MLKELINNRQEIHTRDISLASYPHTDSTIIVNGILKDQRRIRIFDVTGTPMEPGIIHHMEVILLIKSDPLRIADAEAAMIHVPMPECRTTLDTVEKLKGLEIRSGFSKNIRDIMGKKTGCTHLSQLVLAMGQEIVHGWLSHKRKIYSLPPENFDNFDEKKFLIDSCRMWTKNGPKMKNLENAMKKRTQA
ncbi:MAG: hypothetical protein A2097_06260 [Desulfobacula sp. GWF2_41_7]|nr:MAG: hypothetical protein A2097_06260 [Desulfobacula sp. GWF2_41_7]